MADLFDTSVQNVDQRIQAILADGELPEATLNSELIVRQEGSRLVRREVQLCNLDMILAVGYCVRSPRGMQFRQWATTVLREYLVKGFALNDERLKDPIGFDYFDELFERIRDIRAAERVTHLIPLAAVMNPLPKSVLRAPHDRCDASARACRYSAVHSASR